MAVRSKTWVYGRSLVGVVGSNSAGGMDVCLISLLENWHKKGSLEAFIFQINESMLSIPLYATSRPIRTVSLYDYAGFLNSIRYTWALQVGRSLLRRGDDKN